MPMTMSVRDFPIYNFVRKNFTIKRYMGNRFVSMILSGYTIQCQKVLLGNFIVLGAGHIKFVENYQKSTMKFNILVIISGKLYILID